MAWFENTHLDTNAIPTYKLQEENIGWVSYTAIMMHQLELTLHGQVRAPIRRKLLRILEKE